jgi:hypothetical protein
MRSNSLIWISLLALSGTASAAPATRASVSSGPSQVEISTHRSDGAVFPAVGQAQRLQKRRIVRVSSSTQALSNRIALSPNDEPTTGGRFVAGASGDHLRQDAASLPHQALVPLVVVDPVRAIKPMR